MIYFLSQLIEPVLEPGNFLVLLLTMGVLLSAVGMRRWGASLVGIVTISAFAIMVLPIGGWVVTPLEERFPQPQLPRDIDGIILLGGAVRIGLTIAHGQVALNYMAGRLTETLALARRYPDATVLITGGDAALAPGELSEAAATRMMLVADGLQPERILLEEHARNTRENAVYSKTVAQPRPDQVWVLVTSANHMPRAVGCFRKIGWDVIPYPVDYSSGVPSIGFDFIDEMRILSDALHEWMGLVSYRAYGWTDTLFPAPASR